MDFIEELKWRGMLQDSTPGVEQILSQGMKTGYIGFDPTAPSLTIGNFVQIMLLRLFQLSGHKPIVLMGGATGRIGDPSGKNKERQLKSFDELDKNLSFQAEQFSKFIDFDNGENKAEMVNNLDLEFSYQLLQAYDFQCLYQNQDVILQMGGSDQWGNITSGTEFIRRNAGGKAYALTTPLLTKADGSKFGKSEAGNIWLDPNMTSPYKFYQFWINADDRDLPKFTRYFTLKSRAEVEAMEKDLADNPREMKKMLAGELTIRVHSQADYEAVLKVSELLFNKKASKETLLALDVNSLTTVAGEIPSFKIDKAQLTNGVNILDLMAESTSIVNSKGDARRAIKGGAVSVNKDKISSHEVIIKEDSLLHGKYIMVENGKKNKFMLEVSSKSSKNNWI